jgi:hypothetical protein
LLAAGAGGGAVDRALGYLSSLIAPDGHVRYSRSTDQTPVWVTGQAAMALARKPLPLAAVALPSPTHAGSSHRSRVRAPGRRARHGRRNHHAPLARPSTASGTSLSIASDLGVVTALALAPVGLG